DEAAQTRRRRSYTSQQSDGPVHDNHCRPSLPNLASPPNFATPGYANGEPQDIQPRLHRVPKPAAQSAALVCNHKLGAPTPQRRLPGAQDPALRSPVAVSSAPPPRRDLQDSAETPRARSPHAGRGPTSRPDAADPELPAIPGRAAPLLQGTRPGCV